MKRETARLHISTFKINSIQTVHFLENNLEGFIQSIPGIWYISSYANDQHCVRCGWKSVSMVTVGSEERGIKKKLIAAFGPEENFDLSKSCIRHDGVIDVPGELVKGIREGDAWHSVFESVKKLKENSTFTYHRDHVIELIQGGLGAERLVELEWNRHKRPFCPVCRNIKPAAGLDVPNKGHKVDCELAAVLYGVSV